DEQALKATISELITATEIAGRAVAGLKAAAQECDQTLGERMRAAERLSAELERQIRTGEVIQPAVPEPVLPPPVLAIAPEAGPPKADPKSVVAAALAFAQRARERARARANGRAAGSVGCGVSGRFLSSRSRRSPLSRSRRSGWS